MNSRTILLVMLFIGYPSLTFPEGTRQIKPFPQAEGELCIDKSRNDFAFYNSAPEFRLNICIADLSEKICLGFGIITIPDSLQTIEFRIKDPSGNVVFGPETIPVPGSGFIENYDQALAGPFPSIGGYDPFIYLPAVKGDYYIEFFYPPSFGVYSEENRIQFRYFDITVLNVLGNAVDGRVWSKAWQFNSGPVKTPPTSNRFYGKMNILSDDSIVTKIDCNGFVGGTFSISSNSTGCSTTGNLFIDRLSTAGFHTYPQYKIFLNDPDSAIFPTGKLIAGIVQPVIISPHCVDGSVDFGVQVSMDGLVEMVIDVNPSLHPDPLDVKLTAYVLANPGGNGYNTIHWNGMNSLLQPVPNGAQLLLKISNVSGLTHLPIYDIEYNDFGYKVQQIRPQGNLLKIYWDDTNLMNGTMNTIDGCNDPAGCHTWDYAIGDVNTINSWWYVNRSNIPPIPFEINRNPGTPGEINGPVSVCRGSNGNFYTIDPEPSSTEYQWSYSGKGVLLHVNGLSVTIDFSDSATTGSLSVFGHNPDCGDGPPRTKSIVVNVIPGVQLIPFDTICYNQPVFGLSGGTPAGGVYTVDGIQSETFEPKNEQQGSHTIIYSFVSTEGCSSADTAEIIVINGQECEPLIYFPNAFTPNGDGLNDTFKPVARNIIRFLMEIYNRQGERIFTSTTVDQGWDGTFKGEECPSGVYIYKATYGISPDSPESKTVTGTITLL